MPNTLLVPTCGHAACHEAARPAASLDLASPGQGMRMIDHTAMGGPGLLIDPVFPEKSVILLKVSATPPFGSRMPLAGTPLDAMTIQCLHDWAIAQIPPPGGDGGTADMASPPDGSGSD